MNKTVGTLSAYKGKTPAYAKATSPVLIGLKMLAGGPRKSEP